MTTMTKFRGRIRPLVADDSGAVMAEFALVLPLVLLLLFGIIDFGRVMFTQNNITSAVREGARFGAVAEVPQDTAAIRARVQNYITSFGGSTTVPISVTLDDWALPTTITVRIQNYPFTPVTPVVGTISLTSRAVFRWERSS